MEMTTLKNGTEEAEPLVTITMMCLRDLMGSDPLAVYELVMLARDRNHELFGNARQRLEARSLVQHDGRMHDSIRNIVLSAASGDGLDMVLQSPVAPQEQQAGTHQSIG